MKRVFVLSMVAVVVCTVSLYAAETEAQATRHQLRTLSHYPQPLRQGILELLNHPAVLKKVENGAGLKKALKGEKPAVQEAAHLLAKHPDVLKLLKDHPDAFSLAAKAYAENKEKTIARLDQEDKDNDKAADEWLQRLGADPAALKQLREAAQAYVKMEGGSAHDSGISTAGDVVTIHSHPTPKFIHHVMSNADRYSALGNVMTSQWLNAKNSASYDRAFHHWWGKYENHVHSSLLRHDEHRAHRLAELARFDRQHAMVEAKHRYAKLHEHAKSFPFLALLPVHDPNKHTPREGIHHKPDHKDSHPLGKGSHRNPDGGKAHHQVHRKAGSHEHRMHHAKAGHQHHVAHHSGKKK